MAAIPKDLPRSRYRENMKGIDEAWSSKGVPANFGVIKCKLKADRPFSFLTSLFVRD